MDRSDVSVKYTSYRWNNKINNKYTTKVVNNDNNNNTKSTTLTINLFLFGPFGGIILKVEFRKIYHIYNKNICQEYPENKT